MYTSVSKAFYFAAELFYWTFLSSIFYRLFQGKFKNTHGFPIPPLPCFPLPFLPSPSLSFLLFFSLFLFFSHPLPNPSPSSSPLSFHALLPFLEIPSVPAQINFNDTQFM